MFRDKSNKTALLHYFLEGPEGGSIKYSLNFAGFVVFLLAGSWALTLPNADPEETLIVTLELACDWGTCAWSLTEAVPPHVVDTLAMAEVSVTSVFAFFFPVCKEINTTN